LGAVSLIKYALQHTEHKVFHKILRAQCNATLYLVYDLMQPLQCERRLQCNARVKSMF